MLLNYLLMELQIPIESDGSFRYTADIKETSGNNYFLIEASNATDTKQLNRTVYFDASNQATGSSLKKSDKILSHKSNNSTVLADNKLISSIKSIIGEDVKGSYSFSNITLSEFIKIFVNDHQINVINNVESDKQLTVELNDIHPFDLFITLINYWECSWMYKDDIIRIIPQTPVRVFKLSYMQGESNKTRSRGLYY